MEEIIKEESIPDKYINNFLNKLEDESVQSRMECSREDKEDFEIKTALNLLQELMTKVRNKEVKCLGYKLENVTDQIMNGGYLHRSPTGEKSITFFYKELIDR